MTKNYPIEELLPRSGNSMYRLVRLAAIRALELADGKALLIPNPSSDKLTTIALEEILRGKVLAKEGVKSGLVSKKIKEHPKEQKEQKEEKEEKESVELKEE